MNEVRYWEKEEYCDGEVVYTLMFTPYYDTDAILHFSVEKGVDGLLFVTYTSDILGKTDDIICVKSLDEAKETLEQKIETCFEEQVSYYKQLLERWNERSTR